MPYKVPKIAICEHFPNVLYHKNSLSFVFQVLLFDTFTLKKPKIIFANKTSNRRSEINKVLILLVFHSKKRSN